MMDPEVTQVTSLHWLELVSWPHPTQSDQEVQFYNVPKKSKLRGGQLGEQDCYLTVFLTLVGCYDVNSSYIQGPEWSTTLNFIKKLGHTCFVKEMLPVNFWRGRPRETNFQVDEVQIGETVFFSPSGKKIKDAASHCKSFYLDTRHCEEETVNTKGLPVFGGQIHPKH